MILSNTRKALFGAKDIGAIGALTFAFTFGLPVYQRVQDTRAYRDFFQLTPFYDVNVLEQALIFDPVAMDVSGTMKKRRCERMSVVFHTSRALGPLVPATFVPMESKDTPLNRPSSPLEQVFGPWRIISNIPDPQWAYMFATHDCDEGVQTNRVFKIEWAAKP